MALDYVTVLPGYDAWVRSLRPNDDWSQYQRLDNELGCAGYETNDEHGHLISVYFLHATVRANPFPVPARFVERQLKLVEE